MLKQVLGALIVLVVVLAVPSPASAGGLGVIFDPIPSLGCGANQDLFCLVNNGAYSFNWQNCAVEPSGVLPTNSPLIGDAACVGVANDTGGPIASVWLSFTVTPALNNLQLTCSYADPFLSNNNCAVYSGGLTTGEQVTLTFTATGPSNDVPANTNFYFGLTGISSSNAPPAGIQVPTYDPNTLVLLAVGIAVLAMGGVRRVA